MIALEFKDYSRLLRPPWLSPGWDLSFIFKCQPVFLTPKEIKVHEMPCKIWLFVQRQSHSFLWQYLWTQILTQSTKAPEEKVSYYLYLLLCQAKISQTIEESPKRCIGNLVSNVAELIDVAGCHF